MSPYYRLPVDRPHSRGWWHGEQLTTDLSQALMDIDRDLYVVDSDGTPRAAIGGRALFDDPSNGAPEGSRPIIAHAPACTPQQLGDPRFLESHGVDYPYVAGSMANGIASVELVEALAAQGILAFFGCAGLPIPQIERAIDQLQASLADKPHGYNLIHSPGEPALESETVDLFLRKNVRLVEASAFLDLTLPVVRYRVHGIHRTPDGRIVAPHRLVAKASRVEVASKFMAPPPEALLEQLVRSSAIDEHQAQLAREIPMAEDLTAEADSGGHTDNRPALALLPTFIDLAHRKTVEHGFEHPLRVGAAGGIASPASTLAAFSMGAAYVLTGTINQACLEAGTCDAVREMLAEAEQADVIMAPAADMFEMGVQVQVLKRGTMFAMRAQKLYDAYKNYRSLDEIPAREREQLEKTLFRCSLDEVWTKTRDYFEERDPQQVVKAQADERHRMALVFRWYLGLSSNWANSGVADRRVDYQVWCGPAMGAFNEWTRDSFLADPNERRAVTVALNLMFGACVLQRLHALRSQGFHGADVHVRPIDLETLESQFLQPKTTVT